MASCSRGFCCYCFDETKAAAGVYEIFMVGFDFL